MRKSLKKTFVNRLLFAGVLVLLTYNIWDFGYYNWAFETPFEGFNTLSGAGKIVAGIVLSVAYLILIWATIRALGVIGIVIMMTVLFAFVYLVWAGGLIDLGNTNSNIIVGQVLTSIMLAEGSVWGIFWRRSTGQVLTEDPDTDNDGS